MSPKSAIQTMVQKYAFRCPHCDHSQTEAAHFIQTICRHCGQSFAREQSTAPAGFLKHEIPSPQKESAKTLTKALAKSEASEHTSASKHQTIWQHTKELAKTILSSSTGRLPSSTFRPNPKSHSISCAQCGHEHLVSTAAKSSICPKCGTAICLENIAISHHTSRIIDTRGTLIIEKKGFLNSNSAICRNAIIKGKICGTLFCDDTLKLCCNCRLEGRVTAHNVLIDRNAHVVFTHPVRAKRIVVRGIVSGVLVCDGAVHLKRGGVITGAVFARSFRVDKGGQFLGSITITTQSPPESLAPYRKPKSIPDLKIAEPEAPHRIETI